MRKGKHRHIMPRNPFGIFIHRRGRGGILARTGNHRPSRIAAVDGSHLRSRGSRFGKENLDPLAHSQQVGKFANGLHPDKFG
ncbi:hypothetical protein EUGRSUZ_J02612 [Eucalyptus grandis]|uniref:Uncharacterized protein n=2 Tax=Eucalyptus grandis TaxID=71139 RepID=A0ACC3J9N3_EUCGR|nr:hypothetical protein EUGRSUZ_J02612 [Eucalyptus grandis]